eukprot:3730609-Rhodomonas_salina.1
MRRTVTGVVLVYRRREHIERPELIAPMLVPTERERQRERGRGRREKGERKKETRPRESRSVLVQYEDGNALYRGHSVLGYADTRRRIAD